MTQSVDDRGPFSSIDDVVSRFMDALLSIPTLFLALVVVSLFPPTEGELILVVVASVACIDQTYR